MGVIDSECRRGLSCSLSFSGVVCLVGSFKFEGCYLIFCCLFKGKNRAILVDFGILGWSTLNALNYYCNFSLSILMGTMLL